MQEENAETSEAQEAVDLKEATEADWVRPLIYSAVYQAINKMPPHLQKKLQLYLNAKIPLVP